MNRCSNPYVAMAVLSAMGASFIGAQKGPRARLVRRLGRRVEYKDGGGEVAAVLGELKGLVASIGDRLKTAEGSLTELKSLDADIKAITSDLVELKKTTPQIELKSLDDRFGKLGNQLDEMEKKINAAVADVRPKGKAGKKSFATCKSLDEAMRAQQDIELKSLDSDLKQQDIFHDDRAVDDFPLIEMATSRPTRGDTPRFSYPAGGEVTIKGQAEGAQVERKKVTLTVQTYKSQPTLEREDVDDAGSLLMDDAQAAHVEGVRERLNQTLVDAVEAKLLDAADEDFDEFVSVALYETDGTAITDADLNTLVSALARRYRRGAVFVGNASMTAKLRNIRDAITGVSLWNPSLAAGVPSTLKGYEYIEDENVANGRLLFGNPRRGLAIGEREKSTLSNIERSGGDYRPYFAARYAAGVLDPRAWKAMDEAASS